MEISHRPYDLHNTAANINHHDLTGQNYFNDALIDFRTCDKF